MRWQLYKCIRGVIRDTLNATVEENLEDPKRKKERKKQRRKQWSSRHLGLHLMRSQPSIPTRTIGVVVWVPYDELFVHCFCFKRYRMMEYSNRSPRAFSTAVFSNSIRFVGLALDGHRTAVLLLPIVIHACVDEARTGRRHRACICAYTTVGGSVWNVEGTESESSDTTGLLARASGLTHVKSSLTICRQVLCPLGHDLQMDQPLRMDLGYFRMDQLPWL